MAEERIYILQKNVLFTNIAWILWSITKRMPLHSNHNAINSRVKDVWMEVWLEMLYVVSKSKTAVY